MQNQLPTRLHGDADAQRNNRAIRRRLAILAITTGLMVALVTASLIWRDNTHVDNVRETPSQVFTIAVSALWGGFAIFFWDLKVAPYLHYRKFLRDIRTGLHRTVEGRLTRFDTQTTFRNGLGFYAVMVNIGRGDDPEDDRLLYWDASLPKPALHEGDRVLFLVHGNEIIGLQKQ